MKKPERERPGPDSFQWFAAGAAEFDSADDLVELSRTFPDKGKKPFKMGDEVELAVGLWGLGEDASTRRPVLGVCKVTLSFPRKTAKLKVVPPDTAGK